MRVSGGGGGGPPILLVVVIIYFFPPSTIAKTTTAKQTGIKYATTEQAEKWLSGINPDYTDLKYQLEKSSFEAATDLTNKDKSKRSDKAVKALIARLHTFRQKLKGWDMSKLPKHLRRQLISYDSSISSAYSKLSKTQLHRLTELNKEQNDLADKIKQAYQHARICRSGRCSTVEGGFIDQIMIKSRNYTELTWAWKSVRDMAGRPMRNLYAEFVKGKRERGQILGYNPAAVMIENEVGKGDGDFDKVAMKLWDEIKPLYKQLHAYVRHKLVGKYPGKFRPDGPIPAHLFGNMYAQQWTEIAELMWPYPDAPVPHITESFVKQKYTVHGMFKLIESLFVSMGMNKMTDKFWKYSMLEKPTDGRKAECHGSAFDMFSPDKDDFRIKICTLVDQDSYQGASHEMGHIQYDMAFSVQPPFFRSGVSTAFHEATADTSLLANNSPKRLHKVGLYSDAILNDKEADINALMKRALWDIPLLPWTLLIDTYRWGLINGSYPLDKMNEKWWDIRLRFQGMKPPIERTEKDFDAGSKFHIAYDVGYFRYFLDNIMKYEFLKSLCDVADPGEYLHRCDLTESKEAGKLWLSMLSLGSSKPWRDTKKVLTGGDGNFNVGPLIEYYKPLHEFLEDYNTKNNIPIGWD